jgi:hypothetical protein
MRSKCSRLPRQPPTIYFPDRFHPDRADGPQAIRGKPLLRRTTSPARFRRSRWERRLRVKKKVNALTSARIVPTVRNL